MKILSIILLLCCCTSAQPIWVDVPNKVIIGNALDITVRISSPPFRFSRLIASTGTAQWEIKNFVKCGLVIDQLFLLSFSGISPFIGWNRIDHLVYSITLPRLTMVPKMFSVQIPNNNILIGVKLYFQAFTWKHEDNTVPLRLDESNVEFVTIGINK